VASRDERSVSREERENTRRGRIWRIRDVGLHGAYLGVVGWIRVASRQALSSSFTPATIDHVVPYEIRAGQSHSRSLIVVNTAAAMPSKSIFRQPGAQHFQLVHRSQRDPLINDPDASQHVLKPVVRENAKKVTCVLE
jgi:hypothetical protein